jgi:hypothetical protein
MQPARILHTQTAQQDEVHSIAMVIWKKMLVPRDIKALSWQHAFELGREVGSGITPRIFQSKWWPCVLEVLEKWQACSFRSPAVQTTNSQDIRDSDEVSPKPSHFGTCLLLFTVVLFCFSGLPRSDGHIGSQYWMPKRTR